jgi:2-oxoglutarate dehydrogenase E1 component
VQKFSYLKSINADYLDQVYQSYLKDPNTVEESFRYFFEGIEFEKFEQANEPQNSPINTADLTKEFGVLSLIKTFRDRGYLYAQLNPLSQQTSPFPSLESFGLEQNDLNRQDFASLTREGFPGKTLQEVLQLLQKTYTHSIAIESTHIERTDILQWLRSKIETASFHQPLPVETKKYIYQRLLSAEQLERFLHTRYVAQKRFSVEGGDVIIPALDALFETSTQFDAEEFVIGMAHRGRLNVLVNIMGKHAEDLFSEFEGKYQVDPLMGEGDVKYHKGYSRDTQTRQGKPYHLSLAFNPSHLEFVNPVVQGMVRAKQTLKQDHQKKKVIPIQIHGDAAFAGQGVCYETLNFVSLDGFSTGGTLHFIINNQVGFTTLPKDSRSTRFSSDLMKMLGTPILHVNGDDSEAVWKATQLAAEFRQTFKLDIILDIICYRKYGHNEGDEPSFTQPLMYQSIKEHLTPREVYGQQLLQEGILATQDQETAIAQEVSRLTEAQTIAKDKNPSPKISAFEKNWKPYHQPTLAEIFEPRPTAVEAKTLLTLSQQLNTVPTGFNLHPKLNRFLEARLKAIESGQGIDWGNAESLAFGSLLNQNIGVRITGQDAERGTFTHRHSVWYDTQNGTPYTPLNHLKSEARYQVHNSHLSETGVLGFEHGYSLADPSTLTIWEAQFGDFANGAQVIIDQFISSSEQKWRRMSGLTLLLPHGYEGQGPEHSSARLERFLNLCAKNNLFVMNLTTPAQIFHALRRQILWSFRKPLVIMSPKSLLRHPQAISTLQDLSEGSFQEIIDSTSSLASKKQTQRILLCSGKVYYDLENTRQELGLQESVAIIRIEQLYPLHEQKLATLLNQYPSTAEIVWVQEEPRNMGAWSYLFNLWSGGTGEFSSQVQHRSLRYVGRPEAAAPAVGSAKVHDEELKLFLKQAFQNLKPTS